MTPRCEPGDVDRGKKEPDAPKPSAMSMLEVAEEARHRAVTQRNAAADVVRHYAIAALMDGEPPAKVALAAGFQINLEPGPITIEYPGYAHMVFESIEDIPPPLRSFASGGVSGMETFAQWLCDYLYKRVTGEDP